MRIYLSILLFQGLVWGQKTTIAVFDFENNGLENQEVRQLSKRLESELVKVGKYNVVERSKIDEILKEQNLQLSGCVDTCLIEVGKLLGASQIVIGSVGKFDLTFTMSAKLIDATSGRIIKSHNYDSKQLIDLLKLGAAEIALSLSGMNKKNKAKHIEKNNKNFKIEKTFDSEDVIYAPAKKNFKNSITANIDKKNILVPTALSIYNYKGRMIYTGSYFLGNNYSRQLSVGFGFLQAFMFDEKDFVSVTFQYEIKKFRNDINRHLFYGEDYHYIKANYIGLELEYGYKNISIGYGAAYKDGSNAIAYGVRNNTIDDSQRLGGEYRDRFSQRIFIFYNLFYKFFVLKFGYNYDLLGIQYHGNPKEEWDDTWYKNPHGGIKIRIDIINNWKD